jgi:hypothetical protein
VDKSLLIEDIIKRLQQQRQSAIAAADVAKETATHTENIAENRYDTLGLEASYLAHGQSLRTQAIETSIESFKTLGKSLSNDLLNSLSSNLDIRPSSVAQVGSLIELEDPAEQRRWYFLAMTSGGLTIHSQGKDIFVLTPQAPMGAALMGKEVGDDISLNGNVSEVMNLL